MKFKLRYFLWLSSLMVSLLIIALGYALPELSSKHPEAFQSIIKSNSTSPILHNQLSTALFSLAAFISISSTILFLVGKNFGKALYSGIFALLMLISIVLASASTLL